MSRYKTGWSSRSGGWMIHNSSSIRYTGIGSGVELTGSRAKKDSQTPKTFEEIRDELVAQGQLWEDPDFPAEDSSIYFKNPPSVWPGIKWMRPKEICSNPEMFVGGASRLDVNQGALGDCWLLAAVSCLATSETMLHNVVPADQSFDDNYAGIFRFRFWSYGQWIEVFIDDRLPTKNGKLVYMHSEEKSEFWSALLEKAYAKLSGSYEALSGGLTVEALTDFTGGVAARHELQDKAPTDLFQIMYKASQNGALMGCSIDADAKSRESQLPNGLLIGHAYSITDVRLMDVKTSNRAGQIPMVRVRNPWGDSHEWKGAWSDNSQEWQLVPDDERQDIGLVYKHDGEFWMSYKDFVSNFQRLEICFLGPDGLALDSTLGLDNERSVKWESNIQEGSWMRSVNAGGCKNYPQSFWTNPQYRITIDDKDPDDNENSGTIVLGVMQKDRRKLKNKAMGNLVIGYYIFKLGDKDAGTLNSNFFRTNQPVAKSSQFSDLREVSGVHKLPCGNYVVMPTTFEPNEVGDFIVRLFSERKADALKVMDEETGAQAVKKEDIIGAFITEEDKANKKKAKQGYIDLAGKDGEIDAYEFMEFLNKVFPKQDPNSSNGFKTDGFSADMTRTMVALEDTDVTGKLGYEEFKKIWTDLVLCTKVFRNLDTDGTGYFSSFELRTAFYTLGFTISNATFAAIAIRHSDNNGRISFDDFILCFLQLKSAFTQFSHKDPAADGRANFQFEEFLKMTMYS